MCSAAGVAQSVPPPANAQQAPEQVADTRPTGSLQGSVTDGDGKPVAGARALLGGPVGQTTITAADGSFRFYSLPAGSYHVTITANGLATATSGAAELPPGGTVTLPTIVLAVASATTNVTVTVSQEEIAEAQISLEEQQRLLGVLPNFYVSYIWKAAPLTPRQKFQLAWKSSIDPGTFVGTGIIAGIQQWQNDFSGYGQGAEGYVKRFGAAYADGVTGNFVGGAIFPTLLHQDPRYFYKGTGTAESRAGYAIANTVICRGDNGRWQPNYSNVLGTLAAGGISNLYYPASNRNGFSLTVENSAINIATGAINNLVQEFFFRKLTPGVPGTSAGEPVAQP